MRCPFCDSHEDKVIDSRQSKDGREIRRRRECEGCARRFTTYERVIEHLPLVVKSDGRRQDWDRGKVLHGIKQAAAKRPVSIAQMEQLAADVERELCEEGAKEVPSLTVGERVLPKLRELDEVAYVRFASIYRNFRDVDEFMREITELVSKA